MEDCKHIFYRTSILKGKRWEKVEKCTECGFTREIPKKNPNYQKHQHFRNQRIRRYGR